MLDSSVNLSLELPHCDLNISATSTNDPIPMVWCMAPGSLHLAGLRSPPTSLHPTAEFKVPAQARQLSTLFKFETSIRNSLLQATSISLNHLNDDLKTRRPHSHCSASQPNFGNEGSGALCIRLGLSYECSADSRERPRSSQEFAKGFDSISGSVMDNSGQASLRMSWNFISGHTYVFPFLIVAGTTLQGCLDLREIFCWW